jgi:hypothetical protein
MSCPERRHVYGPVPPHRLGRSLGVDIVPFKAGAIEVRRGGGTFSYATVERWR